MLTQLKIKLAERFDNKMHAALEEVFSKADIHTEVHLLDNPCIHPNHTHAPMRVVEIFNPPTELHTFINVQSNFGGRRYLIQIVRAEDIASIGTGYGQVLPTYKQFVVPAFEHVRDHIVLEWIEYRMNA